MNPTLDLLFRLLMAGAAPALVASVILGRRLTDRAAAAEAHDPYQCRDCAPLRHPCNQDLRKALATIPRQTRGGGQ